MEIDEQKHQDRLEVLKRIEQYEKEKKWDIDAENDPPAPVLMPDKVDFLHEKWSSRVARRFAFAGATRFMKKILKNKQLIIEDIIGLENLSSITTGKIVTCNHFNAMDTFAVQYATLKAGIKKTDLYRVIREGNYTNFPGFFGMLMRNCNTLPLSSNMETMKLFYRAVEAVLRWDKTLVVYPEKAMWWNYKKPRKIKDGVFKMSFRTGVPVVPMFITMRDSDIMEDNGFYTQKYTIHIFPAIYPDPEKTRAENISIMHKKHFEYWKNCYESFYNTKYDLDIE